MCTHAHRVCLASLVAGNCPVGVHIYKPAPWPWVSHLLPFCSSSPFPGDQVKLSYKLLPASVHCFQLEGPVFPIKAAIPGRTGSQKDRVKQSYCSLELNTCLSPAWPTQSHYYLVCFLPTRSEQLILYHCGRWKCCSMESYWLRYYLAWSCLNRSTQTILMTLVSEKALWLWNCTDDTSTQISFAYGSNRAKIWWPNARLWLTSAQSTKFHTYMSTASSSLTVSVLASPAADYVLFCQIFFSSRFSFYSHPPVFFPSQPCTRLAPSSHTRVICRFGRWLCRRNMISFNISLVMFSDKSYSNCL